MNSAPNNFIMRNTAFAWIALATCLALLVPLIAMRFTGAVNWDIADFIVMGILLFGTGSIYVFVARKLPRKFWIAIGVVFAVTFIYVYAELAVGIFSKLGS